MAEHFERIELANGPLRFSALAGGLAENPEGALVLCLHGFPDNARSFRFQLPALAKAGYRAIAPTLRGYEPSSQPEDGDYSLEALANDVIAWIDHLGAEQVHLIGHDWGAAITYAAGAMAPERFHTLATIAVPHAARLSEGIREVPSQLRKSWYMTFFQLRGIAEWAVERNDWALVKRLWRDWSPDFDLPGEEWETLRATFEAPGVKRAMLGYYRFNASPGVMLGWKQTAASRLTSVPVPTLAITGADDGCMDTRLYDHVFLEEDFPNGFQVERIENAGHFVHQEEPEQINRLLLEWIGGGQE
ncbi:MAG: alpha/beta hydrolase [bacterium]|nr:alpha/beta hydrolase [bacterium]